MKYRSQIVVMSMACLLGISTLATAAPEPGAESAPNAEEAELKALLEVEYERAMAEAAKQRGEAEASMEKARQQLHLANEHSMEENAERNEARKAHQAEVARAQEELRHTQRQLRETSREVSRVNRELSRVRITGDSTEFIVRTGNDPVIGVILGGVEGVGVKILGVSPDGPSDRAGMEPGDVIVAMGGTVLASANEDGNPRTGLKKALQLVRVDEPVVVSVERGDQTLDLTVIPEVREPLGYQFVTRFSTAPESRGETIMIEQIEVPKINTEKLAEQIEKMKIEVDGHRMAIEAIKAIPRIEEFEYQYDFDDMSELGHFALHDASVWFGLPLTQGLKLAEVDPDLGEYFKTDRGVLVLKARADNDMQLESGDVILQVGDAEVNSPSGFMRAFREFDPGEAIEIEIKRDRKNKTLTVTMPERQARVITPEHGEKHTIMITRDSD